MIKSFKDVKTNYKKISEGKLKSKERHGKNLKTIVKRVW